MGGVSNIVFVSTIFGISITPTVSVLSVTTEDQYFMGNGACKYLLNFGDSTSRPIGIVLYVGVCFTLDS